MSTQTVTLAAPAREPGICRACGCFGACDKCGCAAACGRFCPFTSEGRPGSIEEFGREWLAAHPEPAPIAKAVA